ncbi:hypothetical protein [Kordia zhangzhouensis]|uniref:hypothetical protein n=1 Tax=Kordia zhangzhouensis TaxID=1620405 RepID=UPI00062958D8|nr:hypothetical protein [Kordia zhangzhouensis]
MKLLKNYNVKASSLLESVMATAIIAICMVVATIVFVNVFKTNFSTDYIQAHQKIHTIIHELHEQDKIEAQTYTFSNFTIEQEVNNYEDNSNIKQIDFTITTNTKTETFTYLISTTNEVQP